MSKSRYSQLEMDVCTLSKGNSSESIVKMMKGRKSISFVTGGIVDKACLTCSINTEDALLLLLLFEFMGGVKKAEIFIFF